MTSHKPCFLYSAKPEGRTSHATQKEVPVFTIHPKFTRKLIIRDGTRIQRVIYLTCLVSQGSDSNSAVVKRHSFPLISQTLISVSYIYILQNLIKLPSTLNVCQNCSSGHNSPCDIKEQYNVPEGI